MKKKILLILSLCITLVASAIPVYASPTSAQFTSVKLQTNELNEIKTRLSAEGVPQEKQNLLIQKIQKGELIDSINPEKRAALPEDFFAVDKMNSEKKYIYPDGSYTKLSIIEISPENRQNLLDTIGNENKVNTLLEKTKNLNLSPASVETDYNIWVQEDDGLTGGGFQCAFTVSYSYYSYIRTISDELVWCLGGTSSNEKLSMVRSMENSSSPAQAKLGWAFQIMGGTGQFNYVVNFYIKNSQYWSEIDA